jgi:dihydroxy-acid dehydratase
MDAKINAKEKLPRRHRMGGSKRAHHRTDCHAVGPRCEQAHQPFVGAAAYGNEIAPCDAFLMRQAHAALHLSAVAHECGLKLDLSAVAEVFKKTPYFADLKPGGRYLAKDMFEAAGVPLLMRTLLDHGFLHGECLTVAGRTVAENLNEVKWSKGQDVVHPAGKPLSATGGAVGLRGNLAPERAIVRVAGMAGLKFTGLTRCFDGEEACFEAVKNEKYREGDVLVIRHEGPKSGPGMRGMLATTAALHGQGMAARATVDAAKGILDIKLSIDDLAPPANDWKPCAPEFSSGRLWKYAPHAGSAYRAAVIDPGGAAEKTCHADI